MKTRSTNTGRGGWTWKRTGTVNTLDEAVAATGLPARWRGRQANNSCRPPLPRHACRLPLPRHACLPSRLRRRTRQPMCEALPTVRQPQRRTAMQPDPGAAAPLRRGGAGRHRARRGGMATSVPPRQAKNFHLGRASHARASGESPHAACTAQHWKPTPLCSQPVSRPGPTLVLVTSLYRVDRKSTIRPAIRSGTCRSDVVFGHSP